MENPLVTIYIPTFNRKHLLERAVTSVLTQTYERIEVIVVDDCSTDDTIQFLDGLIKKEPRIKYFQNERNSGACVSRNKAINEATGEFITGLDDDDYFLPNRIEDFINTWNLKATHSKNVVCLFSHIIVKTNNFDKIKNYKKTKKVKQKDLLETNWIGNQIFTRTDSLRIVLFDEKLKMWQDFDCWYRLLEGDKIALNIEKYNCVVDISHPHERITLKKVENIYNTFEYLKNKYNLDKTDSFVMKTHVYGYDKKNLTLKIIYKLFRTHKNLKVLRILMKILLMKNIKNLLRK